MEISVCTMSSLTCACMFCGLDVLLYCMCGYGLQSVILFDSTLAYYLRYWQGAHVDEAAVSELSFSLRYSE